MVLYGEKGDTGERKLDTSAVREDGGGMVTAGSQVGESKAVARLGWRGRMTPGNTLACRVTCNSCPPPRTTLSAARWMYSFYTPPKIYSLYLLTSSPAPPE